MELIIFNYCALPAIAESWFTTSREGCTLKGTTWWNIGWLPGGGSATGGLEIQE